MDFKFEIFGKSVKEKNKSKCGDNYAYKTFNNQYVILALSDGVGSKPCDWLASQTTCEKFVEYALNALDSSFSLEGLIEICKRVDTSVSLPPDNCKGMMSVFSGLIWNIDNSYFHFVNVGDTRIYKVAINEEVTQISIDDSKDINMRDRTGKLILSGGSVVTRTGITNAFGMGNVIINPEVCKISPGETIFLSSDGFYNCHSTFNNDLINISQSQNLKDAVEKVFNNYQDYQNDDATLIVLRNNEVAAEILRTASYINYKEYKNKIAKFQLVRIIYEELKVSILKREKNTAMQILDLMDEEKILPTKDLLDDLILILKNANFMDVQIFNGIVKLIRTIMK